MAPTTDTSIWIFGYGSLVWRPDFEFAERRMCRVEGWRRRFWQASPDHRGTPEKPGRVATMLRWPGGGCWGAAYRLPEQESAAILEALDRREVAGYERFTVPVSDGPGQEPFAQALTWVAPSHNPNFIGVAAPADVAAIVTSATGPSGSNSEYVLKLAEALREQEDPNDPLFALERLVLDS